MSTSAAGNGGGTGGLFHRSPNYDYEGQSILAKYGESLFRTSTQQAIHEARNAEFNLEQKQLALDHNAALRANDVRSMRLTGGPVVTAKGVQSVADQHTAKSDFRLQVGVPVRV